ncbi:hypothetical protein [Vibrio phage RYC]|nr:hypothetical protein [Vibrio phage RYC]
MKLNKAQEKRIKRAVKLGAWTTSKRKQEEKERLERDTDSNKVHVTIVRG